MKLIESDVSQFRGETKFPMSLHIPQEDVERIFRGRLNSEGIQLSRNKKVSRGVKIEDGGVIRAQYVVGADGARST
jgi:2-polyprenyl-6-methoxyphenol hydroxylase-like FAD-dependent oxidoreductase